MRSLAALALAFVVSIAQVSAFLPPSLPAPAGGLPRSETRRSIQTPGAVCSLPKPHSTPVFGRRGEKTSLRIFDKLFGGGKDKEPVAPRGGGKAPPCTCRGTGAIGCPTCAGTGIDKKGGNVFERWKCMNCQGFGQKGCPGCGSGGLTPEQTGER